MSLQPGDQRVLQVNWFQPRIISGDAEKQFVRLKVENVEQFSITPIVDHKAGRAIIVSRSRVRQMLARGETQPVSVALLTDPSYVVTLQLIGVDHFVQVIFPPIKCGGSFFIPTSDITDFVAWP